MTMTLKEVRDQIASLEGDDSRRKAWVASIDAHLAGMGEPVAEAWTGGRRWNALPLVDVRKLPDGTKLYTASPYDIAAVRGVIADIHRTLGHLLFWAERIKTLTAALPKETP